MIKFPRSLLYLDNHLSESTHMEARGQNLEHLQKSSISVLEFSRSLYLCRLPSATIFPIFSKLPIFFLYFEQTSYVFLYFLEKLIINRRKSCFHRNLQHLPMSFWGPGGPQTPAKLQSHIFITTQRALQTEGSCNVILVCILKAERSWAFAL